MLPITRATWGELYLFHFSRPLGNPANRRAQASHYLGWALDARERIDLHLAGRGAAITRAAIAAGIDLTPHILGPAVKDVEYIVKRSLKKTHCLCPDCCRAHGRRPLALPIGIVQLELPLWCEPAPWELPGYAVPRVSTDWYEARHYRSQGVVVRAPLADTWDEGLL
jgi:hypothetical protein